jgi:hypothetical protein
VSAWCDFSTRPRRRGAGRLDRALLVLALAMALGAGYAAWQAWADLGRVQTSLERARRSLEADRQRLGALGSRSGGSGETLASQVVLSREAPPQRLVAELTQLLPAQVRLDGLRLHYRDRLELSLRVRARRPEAYDRFLVRLAASPLFSDVLPGEESRGEELTASLRLTYRNGATP